MENLDIISLIMIAVFSIVLLVDIIRMPIKEVTWKERVMFCMLAIIILRLI